MLAESKDASIPIHEFEIDTIYENDNKSSHFQPIKSSFKSIKYLLSLLFQD